MKGNNTTWPLFAKIQVHPSQVKPLIRYLNDCGWEGDDCYYTVKGDVQVRLKDEQDKYRLDRAMKESGRPRLSQAEARRRGFGRYSKGGV